MSTNPDKPDIDELREQIDQTREELAQTVEALAAKTDVKARAQDKVADVTAKAHDKAAEVGAKAHDTAAVVGAKAHTVGAKAAEASTKAKVTARQKSQVVLDKVPPPVRAQSNKILIGLATVSVALAGWLIRRSRTA